MVRSKIDLVEQDPVTIHDGLNEGPFDKLEDETTAFFQFLGSLLDFMDFDVQYRSVYVLGLEAL
jgi:hypothetical protein